MSKPLLSIFFLCFMFQLFSQNSEELKVFFDCNFCDQTYIKQNLGNVEFVRDQNFADVHMFFLRQTNGSGGRLYEIDFIGKNDLENVNDKLSFSTDTDMTEDDVRKRVLKFIKLGLVRFWIKKGKTDNISVTIDKPKAIEDTTSLKDPWDYWVFQLSADGWFNGEESSKFSNINFSASAKRVTEQNKFLFRIGFRENTSTFSYDGDDIISKNNSKYINVSDVISINSHWSVGAEAGLGASFYRNKDFYLDFKPAIEYNFFKYSESAKKQLALSYQNGIIYNDYIERSVYGENKETLWEHELKLGGSIKQKWGNIYGEASFEQFLHDTTLNSLSFYLSTSLRLFKGFNLNLSGNYSITRNQISLPAGDVTLEELLLQQQQLQSGYNYFFNVGLSYSFGSIYNTIVNPRFNF